MHDSLNQHSSQFESDTKKNIFNRADIDEKSVEICNNSTNRIDFNIITGKSNNKVKKFFCYFF